MTLIQPEDLDLPLEDTFLSEHICVLEFTKGTQKDYEIVCDYFPQLAIETENTIKQYANFKFHCTSKVYYKVWLEEYTPTPKDLEVPPA